MGITIIRKEFANSDFNFVNNVEFEIEGIKKHLEIHQENVKEKLIKEIKDFEEWEEWEQMMYYDYEIEVKKNSLNLFYRSLIISSHSFFEQKMFQLCKIAEKEQDLKLENISGRGIIKYRLFLEKVVGIDFKCVKNEWDRIINFSKLRNFLVHSPDISGAKEKDINSIKLVKGIEYKEKDGKRYLSYINEAIVFNILDDYYKVLDNIYTMKNN